MRARGHCRFGIDDAAGESDAGIAAVAMIHAVRDLEHRERDERRRGPCDLILERRRDRPAIGRQPGDLDPVADNIRAGRRGDGRKQRSDAEQDTHDTLPDWI